MNIYIANIPFKASDAELKELFEQHGEVKSAKIVMDKMTNRSRGFGFVEMTDMTAAKDAIKNLNGSDFQGKALVVNEARPKTDSPGGGNYGNRGGNSGGSFNKRW
ncbi:MAG TPA: RNA-binding protein [Cyclobacteriaceae bacterium]|nr:RNA-binding protein [Cyclobacteriaceae bacterium]